MNNRNLKSPATSQPGFFYGYYVLIASTAIFMVSMGLFFSVGVFFKPMLNDFGWSRAVTSGPMSVSILVSGGMAILTGIVSDKFGPRWVAAF